MIRLVQKLNLPAFVTSNKNRQIKNGYQKRQKLLSAQVKISFRVYFLEEFVFQAVYEINSFSC
jgi:hypothetical protein